MRRGLDRNRGLDAASPHGANSEGDPHAAWSLSRLKRLSTREIRRGRAAAPSEYSGESPSDFRRAKRHRPKLVSEDVGGRAGEAPPPTDRVQENGWKCR